MKKTLRRTGPVQTQVEVVVIKVKPVGLHGKIVVELGPLNLSDLIGGTDLGESGIPVVLLCR